MINIIDKIMIGLSVCNCVLSMLAVFLVRNGIKKKAEMKAYEKAFAEAYDNSRIEVSWKEILHNIENLDLVEPTDKQQIIQVKGTRKSPDVNNNIA